MAKKSVRKKKEKMSKVGRDIIEALEETLAFVGGKTTEGRNTLLVNGQAIDIRNIRNQLGMTREQFAMAFRFNARTVQNWEQGTRRPTDHTLSYLQLIAANPKAVYHTLHPQG